MASDKQLTHEEIEELFREIIVPFFHIRRDISVPEGDRHLENDAEHSWSVAFVACALASKIDPSLDTGLVAQFALVHDIVEVYAGDTSNFASHTDKQTKAQREADALKKIAERFAHLPWIFERVEQYELRQSDEAKFVYAIDKYIPMMFDYLDKGRYLKERKITRERYQHDLAEHRVKAQIHPVVGSYYEKILALVESNDEHFYQGS